VSDSRIQGGEQGHGAFAMALFFGFFSGNQGVEADLIFWPAAPLWC